MASNAKNLAELLNTDSTVAVGDIADGSVSTAKLADDAVTNAKIGANAVGTTEIADDAVTSAKSDGSLGIGKNVIINGAMTVAQRSTSTAGIGASHGYFTCDRWYIYSANNAGRLTMSQDTDAPDGFSKSLKLACTTADTSIGANESLQLTQKIESQNMQHFKKGTSGALGYALSFYVKGNAAATYVAELEDFDNGSRHVGKTFNVTTSWNRVSIIYPGDTTGVLGEDSNAGIGLNIHLHAGSFNTGGTLRETWGTISQADRVGGGKTSFFDSTNRTFFITGVKLEPIQVTDFEHRSFAEELSLCQRYYYKNMDSPPADNIPNTDNTSGNGYMGFIMYSNSSGRTPYFYFPVEMRADPTITVYSSERANTSGRFAIFTGAWGATTSTTPTVDVKRVGFSITTSGGTGNGYGYLMAGGFDAAAEL